MPLKSNRSQPPRLVFNSGQALVGGAFRFHAKEKRARIHKRSLKRKRVPGVLSLSSSKQPQEAAISWLHSTESSREVKDFVKSNKAKTLGGDKRIQPLRLQNHCYSPVRNPPRVPQPTPTRASSMGLESPKSALLCPSADLQFQTLSSVGLSLTFTPVLTLDSLVWGEESPLWELSSGHQLSLLDRSWETIRSGIPDTGHLREEVCVLWGWENHDRIGESEHREDSAFLLFPIKDNTWRKVWCAAVRGIARAKI